MGMGVAVFLFQSAPPRRERFPASAYHLCPPQSESFNPRPREGSDLVAYRCHMLRHDPRFNPRPREGSDPTAQSLPRSPTSEIVSIRAPAKGAIWQPIRWYPTTGQGFNPRPREGSDRFGRGTITSRRSRSCFNPRPREGSDTPGLTKPTIPQRFQSAPPRRER